MAEAYYINNIDLSTLLKIQRVDATAHAPALLQSDYLVPGRTGAVPVQPWFGPSTISIGGIVSGGSRPVYLDRIARFISVCVNSGQPFTMKRVLPRASGTQTSTALARYIGGLEYVDQLSDRAARVMAEFSLLSSFWSDEKYTSVQPQASNFTLSVPGDTATSELIVTLAGGSSQRLTNTSTGDFIEFDASTSATPAVLNIAQFTALQGTTNVIDKVAYKPISTTRYWLTLRPGNNVMTLTGGGTAAIQYKGLFL